MSEEVLEFVLQGNYKIYWVTVGKFLQDNYQIGIDHELWAVKPEHRAKLARVNTGDYVLFCSSTAGYSLCEILREMFEDDTPVWPDATYPYRIEISQPILTAPFQNLYRVLLDKEGKPYRTPKAFAFGIRGANGVFRKLRTTEIQGIFEALDWPSEPPPPPVTRPTAPAEIRPRTKALLELLERRRQMILAGPPGTSKTYTAFQVVAALAGASDSEPNLLQAISKYQLGESAESNAETSWEVVQFHPSYGYEDFVSGIEAHTSGSSGEEIHGEGSGTETTADGQLTFQRTDRIFLQMAQAASNHPDRRYILIIDEINRAILGRVFGELVLTLEYRDLGVRLPGQPKRIRIPENLHIIGTMNTADRNIALVDHALRRRFVIRRCLPSLEILREYLESREVQEGIATQIQRLFWAAQVPFFRNGREFSEKASDAELQGHYERDARGYNLADYAVGHTYFMVEYLEDLWINLRYQVLPLLEEYQKEGILNGDRMKRAADAMQSALSPEEEDGDAWWLHAWWKRVLAGT